MLLGHCYRRATLLLAALGASLTAVAANAPYPTSQAITAATWDLSSVSTLRQAPGSDLWPVTWGPDGNVYGAWGDGGGFEGNDTVGRVSLGFASISGVPATGNPGSFAGANVWGAPTYADNPATFGGKVDELISVGGVLYAQGGFWTAANCGCPDPTQKPGNGPGRTITWSGDLGKTWQISPWSTPKPLGSFLQFGKDYQGAWDPAHVYLYYQQDVNSDPTHVYLRRVLTGKLTEDPATDGHYEYFAGTSSTGAPVWTSTEANKVAIFQDTNVPVGTYGVGGAVYNAPLGRYLLLTFHGNFTGQIGLFEAPNPWGPWATVDYEDDWGGFNETATENNGMQFPTKWISTDGRTLWAAFSGRGSFDSLNVAALTLTTSGSVPQITTPAQGSVLSPGATVTATGTGDTLSWSVAYVGGAAITTGSGTSIVFTVPGDAPANQLIRLSLAGSLGQVYRDFLVGSATGSSAADAPTFTPISGSYSSPQSVTLSDSIAGATIYYTTDGSVPTTASAVYSTPINVSTTETLNAIATAPGYTTSAVASAAYTISIPVAATPAFSPAAGTFTGPQSVTISDSTSGAIIYYTTDGSIPTTSSSVYSGPINVNSGTETIQAIATASGYTTSAVAAAGYTISIPTAATPAFSLPAGTYGSGQSVTITDATPGATVYYTLDGSAPTTSSAVYSTPIAVSATGTIQAIAVAAGYTNSAVAAAQYTIDSNGTPLVSYSSGFASSAGLSLIRANVKSGALVLTDGGASEARAAWYSSPVNVQSFNTTFKFQLSAGNNAADGFTFVVQNARAGAAAVGGGGGSLGYQGVTSSVAVKFDLYNNTSEGNNSTGFYTGGAVPEMPASSMTSAGVNLHSGDVFSVQLTYDGTTLRMTITDMKTSATFTTATAVNIPAIVGSNTAYVGFTGGTGRLTATQKILTWSYSSP